MLSKLSEDVTSDLRSNKVELENTLKSESDSVKKEIGKLYDRVDELYKELEKLSILVDKAKETFFGKAVFKEKGACGAGENSCFFMMTLFQDVQKEV